MDENRSAQGVIANGPGQGQPSAIPIGLRRQLWRSRDTLTVENFACRVDALVADEQILRSRHQAEYFGPVLTAEGTAEIEF